MRRNHDDDDMFGLATYRGREFQIPNDDDDAEPPPLIERKSFGRARRQSPNGVSDVEIDIMRRHPADFEDRIQLQAQRARRRRPVDPTLLMMGIGRRK